MEKIAIIFTVLILAAHANAQDINMQSCSTNINGEVVSLIYDINADPLGPNPWLYEYYTFREILFSGWGEIDCPSAITLLALAPELSPEERAKVCLFWNDNEKTYSGFGEGKRDAYGICKETKTVCQRVGDAKQVAQRFSGNASGTIGGLIAGAAGVATGATTVASAAGVTAVAHSSGAAILTGSSGYVAGSLGSLGATALAGSSAVAAIVTAPATLTVGGIVAAGIGGATYICWEEL